MAEKKYLDYAGAKFLWDKGAEKYVKKETGKGLLFPDDNRVPHLPMVK